MKRRQPPKGRNLVAKAMRECKLFALKTVPAKKSFSEQERKYRKHKKGHGFDSSGPFSLSVLTYLNEILPFM